MEECRASTEGQMDVNATRPTQVFPETSVVVDDRSLDGALKIYSLFVMECWEVGCRPCKLIDPKIKPNSRGF